MVAKHEGTSRARPSHTDKPGQGKTGRMNASEPLMRLRYIWVVCTTRWLRDDDGSGCSASDRLHDGVTPEPRHIGTPDHGSWPRSRGGVLPSHISQERNVETP